jgi:hypothetical protein
MVDLFDAGRLVFASGVAIFGSRVRVTQVYFQPGRGWYFTFVLAFLTFIRYNDTNVNCANASRKVLFHLARFSRV